MSETVGYLLAQSFTTTAENITVNDAGGNRSVAIPATTARVFLAKTSGGAGTEADPKEWLAHVQAQLGGRWTLAMGADGRVTVTYTGTSTGAITWASTAVAKLLGFDANTGTLNNGGAVTGAYLPSHCVFASACDPDTGWTDAPGRAASPDVPMPDGTVYAFDDGRLQLTRDATFRLLPKDWTARTALASVGTPAFSAASRRLAPATGEPGQALPWGVTDTLGTAMGRSCGVCWGNFADLVAGTTNLFEVVYFLRPMREGKRIALSVERYDARRDFALSLSFAGEAQR